jgi:hypothetical protein
MEGDQLDQIKHRVATIIEQLECLREELREGGYGSFAASVQVAISALKILLITHKKTWGSP